MRLLLFVLFLLGVAAVPATAQFPPAQLTNVKALPKDISVGSLIDTMKSFTRALGVRCSFCHVGREDQDLSAYDFASDAKPEKVKARTMLQMVSAINGQYLANLPDRSQPPLVVSCATCHRGVAEPRPLQQVVLGVYHAGGIDSAVAAYRKLRTQFYGRATYDFGEVTLSDVAEAVQGEGKSADAVRFHQLNTELLPNSGFAYRQLGFSLLAQHDTTGAIAAWTRRVELQPNNPEAKQLLAQLGKRPLR